MPWRREASQRQPSARWTGAGEKAGASAQLDAVVLTIARLIGRRMAREDYEKAMRAANDNAPLTNDGGGRDRDDDA